MAPTTRAQKDRRLKTCRSDLSENMKSGKCIKNVPRIAKTNEEFCKAFGIRSCKVVLERYSFPEMRDAKVKGSKKKSKALQRAKSLTSKPCQHVEIGEIVLCKMRGYAPWPALVTGFQQNLICVEFFGDHTVHKAAIKNFYKFADSFQMILSHLRTKKTPLYYKAVQEAEIAAGVLDTDSILNQLI